MRQLTVLSPEELADLREIASANYHRAYYRAYYKANREKIANYHRAYYKANREKIADCQRAYREANRERLAEIGAELRRWRVRRLMTQADLGARVGLTQPAVSRWERGEVPVDFERLAEKYPAALEAFGPELGGVG